MVIPKMSNIIIAVCINIIGSCTGIKKNWGGEKLSEVKSA